MSRVLIRGGRLLDPSIDHDGVSDLLIEEGRVVEVGPSLRVENAEVMEADGKWVAPGFVDLHVHLREPGQEYKEDLASGGRAAVAGGFTSICCMANTEPVNDDPAVTKYILDRAAKDSPARIFPIAAATRRLAGEVMTEMSALKDAGAVAFSDDGNTIMDAWVMRNVLEYSKLVDAVVVIHAEDCGLRANGVVNEGRVSTQLGLPGNPVEAEEIHIARDIRLARLTGARLHVGHVSSGGSVELIREAKEAGLSVTAEVTPHHLALTDEATKGFDTSTKMAPPLRTGSDVEALRRALADGIIDCVATDHAPHATHEKDVEFTAAPCGVLGLETAFGVVNDLVRAGEISPLELMRRMSTAPARIFDLAGGSLTKGSLADVVILDPDQAWVYDPTEGFSKSRNSPWAGAELTGQVFATFVGGRLVYQAGRGVLIQ
ncbi:MAG TPA: dihydroorotase [Myxococcales bacterium]|nr:dihydroorotase [Myxococcales bacterium]HIL80118.1 dihydroorotase [Myxococcales bacterium]